MPMTIPTFMELETIMEPTTLKDMSCFAYVVHEFVILVSCQTSTSTFSQSVAGSSSHQLQ